MSVSVNYISYEVEFRVMRSQGGDYSKLFFQMSVPFIGCPRRGVN